MSSEINVVSTQPLDPVMATVESPRQDGGSRK